MSEIPLTDEIREELFELAGAMREDRIEDVQVARLDQLLADCPGAVELYVEMALLVVDLHSVQRDDFSQVSSISPAQEPKPFPFFAILAAAACLLLVGLSVFRSAERVPTRGAKVATASALLDATFVYGGVDGAGLTSGSAFHAGRYEMVAGILELSYDNGAVVIIEGPAAFSLESDMLLRLGRGNLSAKVPDSALGFTVETEAAKVVDLGTEFSIRATAESSEVHVFDGEVVIQPTAGEEETPVHLYKDQASRIQVDSSQLVGIDVDVDGFFRQLDEPKHTYPQALRALDPVAHYRMRPRDGNVLEDNFGGYHGQAVRVEGHKQMWAPGRIGGSLRPSSSRHSGYGRVDDFPMSDDRNFTVVVWVKADSRPRSAVIAKHAASKEGGLFQLGLNRRSGELLGMVRDEERNAIEIVDGEPFPLGMWQHVALTGDGKTLRLYRNGEEIGSQAYKPRKLDANTVVLGIGAKIVADSGKISGFWDGRIDELGIFHRALTAGEIRSLYEIAALEK
jgi:hypothetical protein